MENFSLSRASHFSIVWGITLAVFTLLEWRGLDRDPLGQEILSPFIERRIAVEVERVPSNADGDIPALIGQDEAADAALRYNVDIAFNGPLFLACFFTPVLIFHGLGLLWARLRRPG